MDYNDNSKYRFTAYLMSAIKHTRMKYREKLYKDQNSKILFDNMDHEFGAILCYQQTFSYTADVAKSILNLKLNNIQLEEILHTLSETELQILTLKFIENLPHHEIAYKLSLTKTAVDKRYQRIIIKLREGVGTNGKL